MYRALFRANNTQDGKLPSEWVKGGHKLGRASRTQKQWKVTIGCSKLLEHHLVDKILTRRCVWIEWTNRRRVIVRGGKTPSGEVEENLNNVISSKKSWQWIAFVADTDEGKSWGKTRHLVLRRRDCKSRSIWRQNICVRDRGLWNTVKWNYGIRKHSARTSASMVH